MVDFVEFPKIARLSREVIVTEKIDGTNGVIYIGEDGAMLVGSRTQWITPEKDNFGFARWVSEHKDELMKLGPGRHYGEWWGSGIQRGYGLPKGEKRFSLFNTFKWSNDAVRPGCCHVVPVLHTGIFSTWAIDGCLDLLRGKGSIAAPGFHNPEGVVIFHVAGHVSFKKTLLKDEEYKGEN